MEKNYCGICDGTDRLCIFISGALACPIAFFNSGNNYHMFKFFLYIALCISLIYVSLTDLHDPHLEVLGFGTYCIYSKEKISSPLVINCIDSGIGYIYYCESSNAAALRTKFNKIDGESISIQNISAERILKKLNYKKICSDTSGNLYGYSGRGRTFIKNGNTRINLQISTRSEITTVGWPVILGSY